MNSLRMDKRIQVLNCLVEGSSIRSTERMTVVHRDTILGVLISAGDHCLKLFDAKVRDVKVKFVEADEIWGFVQKKERRKKEAETDNKKIGDAYTFVGIEAVSKLILCFELGRRDEPSALAFMEKLQKATSGRFQFTTDGF